MSLTKIIWFSAIFFGMNFSSFAHDHKNSHGTEKEAKQLLERAINIVKSNKTVAFAMINVGQGGFHNKDLYPFCVDSKGIMVTHPTASGTDMMSFESSDGVKVSEIMLKNAQEGKVSTLSYMLVRTVSNMSGTPTVSKDESKKITFYTKVGDYVCPSGYHPY